MVVIYGHIQGSSLSVLAAGTTRSWILFLSLQLKNTHVWWAAKISNIVTDFWLIRSVSNKTSFWISFTYGTITLAKCCSKEALLIQWLSVCETSQSVGTNCIPSEIDNARFSCMNKLRWGRGGGRKGVKFPILLIQEEASYDVFINTGNCPCHLSWPFLLLVHSPPGTSYQLVNNLPLVFLSRMLPNVDSDTLSPNSALKRFDDLAT